MSEASEGDFEIVFVCTGNICRSPIAEGFTRSGLTQPGMERFRVSSAGTHGWEGSAAIEEAVDSALEWGVDIAGHVARVLTAEMVERADLVVGLTAEHRAFAANLVASSFRKVFTLRELERLLAVEGVIRQAGETAGTDSVAREDPPGRPTSEPPGQSIGGRPAEKGPAAARGMVARAHGARSRSLPAGNEDVRDPFGGSHAGFREVAETIWSGVERLVGALVSGAAHGR
ncbi:MAG: hypothetical protein WDA71_02480 [Actinomycetota bacterium]